MDLTQLLSMVALETVKFLKRFQQKCKDPQWWKNYVISSLSPRDLRGISDFDSGDLEKLDIAALLKVLKKHWGTIEFNMNVDFEKKHLIDELKTIRNDLCHQGATEKTSMADQHRIIDTMYRFLVLLNADEKNLNLMREEMEKAVRNIANQYGIGKDDKLNHITGKEHVMKEGMALNIFKKGISANKELSELLRERTFVGIDFGTSTTVASYVKHDKEKDILVVNPIPIRQYDDLGREDKNHLLPSCIAWTGKKLLIGTGAVNLKTKYEYEKNIWFSFKMLLGTDLGPQYYRSELRDRSGDYYIETPCDAAAVLFRYLRTEVEAYVKSENLPSNIVYSVSAPAGFESNQRRDLCEALKKAGFAVDHYKIIDEPNAAFIDFIMTKLHEGDWLIDSLQNEGKKILVFDFGAGTCDISILEVKLNNGLWSSKNRGISQFFSLGGDNIDRQIATQVLLAQLIEESGISPDDISSAELDKVIIPKLMPCAEKLKVNCCKQLANSGAKSYEQFKKDESKISGVKISPINFRNKELVLNNPSITHKQFYEVMEPFITPNLNEHKAGWENTTSIFLPISNAMQKAAIDKNNLNIVLFIGGSSQNPYVQDAVKKYFGHGVEKECPTDMRTPVSHGVAMNSLMVNGLGLNLIHPISSEDVIIVAKEGNITLFPAGTEIPSVEVIIADFKPQRDGQKIIEIPICVSLEEKLLGVIKLESEKGFKKKDEIIVKGKFNENKFLEITAAVSGKDEIIQTAVLNPLSNKPLSKRRK